MARLRKRGQAAKAALGINTKSPTPGETGQVKNPRVYRFALQSAAREILPKNRVAWCLRYVRAGQDDVRVMKNVESGKAFYKNLETCGRLWDCPVCAARIANVRRADLAEAFTNAEALGLMPVFGTFTLSHKKYDTCEAVLDALLAAYKRMKSGKSWSWFANGVGLVGDIRALETTHSDANGWHAHIHAVFFVSPGDWSLGYMEEFLKNRWQRMLEKFGAYASAEHGVIVMAGREAVADYLNKHGTGWSLEDELARSSSKSARNKKGATPFGLLAKYLENRLKEGDKQSKETRKLAGLFREYSAAFKGKRHLQFSRGLREKLQMGRELEDVEIVESDTEDAVLLASLSVPDWKVVLSANKRAELLDVAEKAGGEGVQQYVNELRQQDKAKWLRREVGAAWAAEQPSGESMPTLLERAGVCVTCGQTTTDWWFYDGGTGRCRCRACGGAAPLDQAIAVEVEPAVVVTAPPRPPAAVALPLLLVRQVPTTGPPI